MVNVFTSTTPRRGAVLSTTVSVLGHCVALFANGLGGVFAIPNTDE